MPKTICGATSARPGQLHFISMFGECDLFSLKRDILSLAVAVKDACFRIGPLKPSQGSCDLFLLSVLFILPFTDVRCVSFAHEYFNDRWALLAHVNVPFPFSNLRHRSSGIIFRECAMFFALGASPRLRFFLLIPASPAVTPDP